MKRLSRAQLRLRRDWWAFVALAHWGVFCVALVFLTQTQGVPPAWVDAAVDIALVTGLGGCLCFVVSVVYEWRQLSR